MHGHGAQSKISSDRLRDKGTLRQGVLAISLHSPLVLRMLSPLPTKGSTLGGGEEGGKSRDGEIRVRVRFKTWQFWLRKSSQKITEGRGLGKERRDEPALQRKNGHGKAQQGNLPAPFPAHGRIPKSWPSFPMNTPVSSSTWTPGTTPTDRADMRGGGIG